MALGSTTQLQFSTSTDSDTGATVTRLTPQGAICHRTYFYQKSFTDDGKKLLFAGNFDRHWNYHLLDFESQTATQLTEGSGDNTFGGFLSTDNQSLIFVKHNRSLVRVDLATQQHDTLYEVEDGWVGYGTWVPNSACTKVVGIEIKASDYIELTDWKKFAELFHRKPRCRLISIDLQTGQRSTILEENTWLGHPIYRPFDDNTVAFCHEGPHDLIKTRMWLVDENGDNVRKVREQEEGEACTHEFWVPDGSKMIFVSYLHGESDRWICSIEPETLDFKRELKMPPCSHLMSNFDGSMVVGDGSDTPVDVADDSGHQIENDPNIYVFDLKTGSSRVVCRHDTSWEVLEGSRQVNHPHPSFTPDNKQVMYGSDKEGTPAIYLATV
ncbi:oligogalacturonate lyase family protein [Gynuella sunshinyii]|uniref:Periplasmic component of the Tol biopolymer transport system n=1 Tax=Gynuella sunshinyii YC6258 TaxID=1445510 RepID=A0A0C5VIN4_9GAMM|nr:oligogalacturonate lyase family protein [Gynuella sunshinyii]AJQ93203.1 periplasmic component of the Tol biopolymer transport system [Gynuella sunshinyii YC6258]